METIDDSTYQMVVNQVVRRSLDEESGAFFARDRDLTLRETSQKRAERFYYPETKILQETQDQVFERQFPRQFNDVLTNFTDTKTRWKQAVLLAKKYQKEVGRDNDEKRIAVIDCRAKGIFSIWEKMARFNLEPDEVFDTVALRIVVKNTQSARKLSDKILENHQLGEETRFRNIPGKVHEPYSDTLDNPNKNGFASIRMTLIDPDIGPYELQIQTFENYTSYNGKIKQIYASGPRSEKFGIPFTSEELI